MISIRASRSALLCAVVAAACLVAAASASAATIATDRACYRGDTQVALTLGGFAPELLLDVRDNNDFLSSLMMDDAGGFQGTFGTSESSAAVVTHTLTVDVDSVITSTVYRLTPLTVSQRPAALSKPTAKVTLSAQGFTEGGALYAHYVYRPTDVKRVLKKTVKLGTLAGPCGTLTKKVVQLPLHAPKAGVYDVQFDLRPGFQAQVAPYVERSVFVPKKHRR